MYDSEGGSVFLNVVCVRLALLSKDGYIVYICIYYKYENILEPIFYI
jgi:hypothetical protein